MEYKDYYKLLGVPRDADQKAIQKAYRQLARQYHPDVNSDAGAEDRFKEINEAYEVLKDPDKRARYDQLGSSYNQWQRTGGGTGGFDWSPWTQGGVRVEYGESGDMFSDFFQAIFGGGGFSRQRGSGSFDDLFGSMGGRQQVAANRDLETEVQITLDEAYHGTTRLFSKDGRRLQVKIPPGAKTGTRVRIAGEGSTKQGDLYIRVTVQEDGQFERDGDDLYEDVVIDLYTAVLGGEVQLPTMTGDITMKINAGTQPGQVIRLRGRGMPNVRKPDVMGDLYIRVQVEIPEELSAKERALFRELATIYHGG